MLSDIQANQKNLRLSFKQPQLLRQALTHSSFINEMPAVNAISNETLEFLGDAVLGLAIGEKLYSDFPTSHEGELTHLRANLVKTQTIAEAAARLGLGEALLLGRGEEMSGGRKKQRNLAGAYEALIGAIFLDGGWAKARSFVLRTMRPELKALSTSEAAIDAKSRLQQESHNRGRKSPVYHVVTTTGPDHARTFEVAVEIDGTIVGQGSGRSKKEAEQRAAEEALTSLVR